MSKFINKTIANNYNLDTMSKYMSKFIILGNNISIIW